MKKSSPRKSIFLIDAKFLCYRSAYGLTFTSEKELEIRIFYGFLKTLLSLLKGIKHGKQALQPYTYVLCWDSRHSYRRIAFPGYKRRDDISATQLELIKAISKASKKLRYYLGECGLPSYLSPGYEADDIFGSYVVQNPDTNFVIVTNDEDIFQLLTKNVIIYKLGNKPKTITREDFITNYKIPPEKWALVKAIGGCRSDTIPGVPGIGEKRAIVYIQQCEGKDNFDELPTYCKKIRDNLKDIVFYYTLTKIPYMGKKMKNLPMRKPEIDWENFTRFCQIYSFKSIIVDLARVRPLLECEGE